MRICLYAESILPKLGGQELVVDSLARQYQRRGHEVTVFGPSPKHLDVRDAELPYPVQRHLRFLSTWRFHRWYRHALVRLHRRRQFDVIHCHSVYPCGYLAALSRQQLSAPLVVTSHGGDVRVDNPRFRKPGLFERHQQSVRAADRLVAISRFCADGYLRLDPGVAHKIVTIPNGVHLDTSPSPPPRPAWLEADIAPGSYLFFIGRLNPRKGIDVLLEALAQLPPSLAHVTAVIAGGGDIRGELEAQAQRLQLGRRVRFIGPVGGDDKRWLLANAHCLCVPSRDWESFGLVVLEGYAAGQPVIATDLPGMADLIRPGETGWLVPPEDVPRLTTAITEAFQHPQEARRRGAVALADIDAYAWSTIAERHLELYQGLITESSTRAA